MRVLLVGAGAVGQVYGFHLQSGGAEVTFYVRPKYRDQVAKGLSLYRLGGRGARRAPIRFEGYRTISTLDEVTPTDQVWLCVSSTAIRKGDWIAPLYARTEAATWVTLQPGLCDRAYLERFVPAEQLVFGMIPFVSYHGPLPGETLPEPGLCYWLPPASSTPLAGPAAPIAEACAVLSRGGLRARRHPGLARTAAFGSAFLLSHMAALEVSGWSFRSFRQPAALRMAQRASREAAAVAARALGLRPPLALQLTGPHVVRALLRLAPWCTPFDLETYFRIHFSKVGDQTRLALDTYAREAEAHALPASGIRALRQELWRIDQASGA